MRTMFDFIMVRHILVIFLLIFSSASLAKGTLQIKNFSSVDLKVDASKSSVNYGPGVTGFCQDIGAGNDVDIKTGDTVVGTTAKVTEDNWPTTCGPVVTLKNPGSYAYSAAVNISDPLIGSPSMHDVSENCGTGVCIKINDNTHMPNGLACIWGDYFLRFHDCTVGR